MDRRLAEAFLTVHRRTTTRIPTVTTDGRFYRSPSVHSGGGESAGPTVRGRTPTRGCCQTQIEELHRDLTAAEIAAAEARAALDAARQQAQAAQAAADAAQAGQVEAETEAAVIRNDLDAAHRAGRGGPGTGRGGRPGRGGEARAGTLGSAPRGMAGRVISKWRTGPGWIARSRRLAAVLSAAWTTVGGRGREGAVIFVVVALAGIVLAVVLTRSLGDWARLAFIAPGGIIPAAGSSAAQTVSGSRAR